MNKLKILLSFSIFLIASNAFCSDVILYINNYTDHSVQIKCCDKEYGKFEFIIPSREVKTVNVKTGVWSSRINIGVKYGPENNRRSQNLTFEANDNRGVDNYLILRGKNNDYEWEFLKVDSKERWRLEQEVGKLK